MELEKLTGEVIGCAIRVHKELGPGFLKSIYEEAFSVELSRNGICYERQLTLPIIYAGAKVGEHQMDLLVEKSLVVELKAISELENIHFAIIRSYLKAAGLKHGLLLNFASMPLTIKRAIFDISQHRS